MSGAFAFSEPVRSMAIQLTDREADDRRNLDGQAKLLVRETPTRFIEETKERGKAAAKGHDAVGPAVAGTRTAAGRSATDSVVSCPCSVRRLIVSASSEEPIRLYPPARASEILDGIATSVRCRKHGAPHPLGNMASMCRPVPAGSIGIPRRPTSALFSGTRRESTTARGSRVTARVHILGCISQYA